MHAAGDDRRRGRELGRDVLVRRQVTDDVVARREEGGRAEREHEPDRAERVRPHRLARQRDAAEHDQQRAGDQRRR